jgi:long-chain fatty acid transport protein
MDLEGALLVNGSLVTGAASTLVLPAVYTAAVAVWPIRDREREWKVEVDIDYVDWKSVRNLDVRLSGGGTIPQPQDWRTVPTISFGTEYKALRLDSLPHWTMAIRGGYTYTQSQVPDRTFNPGIPSFNSHTLATGIGMTCYHGGSFLGLLPCGRASESGWYPKGMGFDLAFQAWIMENRTVQGNQNPTVDGVYTSQLYLGAVSLRLLF